jgi:hypothetical protein
MSVATVGRVLIRTLSDVLYVVVRKSFDTTLGKSRPRKSTLSAVLSGQLESRMLGLMNGWFSPTVCELPRGQAPRLPVV